MPHPKLFRGVYANDMNYELSDKTNINFKINLIMKKVFLLLTTLMFAFQVSAQKSIVDIAVSADDFSTLVTALKAADLVGALQGDGPFTVFAPTNDAFAKIDSNTLNSLLEPANKSALSNILTYHVVPGNLKATDVVNALEKGNGKAKVKALNGQSLTVMSKDGKIWLKDQNGNYSEIIKTDIVGDNGVIHVISSVVMPK